MTTLTGIQNLDHEILLYLDDKDLSNISQVNKYLYDLCFDEDFWRRRFICVIGLDKINSSLTWKQWYLFWRKKEHNSILSSLVISKKLSLNQAYTFLMTCSGHVLSGSELYQTLDLVLIKAMRKKDDKLIQEFIDKFNLYYETGRGYFNNIDDYIGVIRIALESDYYSLACTIAKIFNRTWIYYSPKKLINTLGQIGADKFYKEEIRHNFSTQNPDKYFLEGLIKERHNAIAESYLEKEKKNWDYWLNISLQYKNEEFISILRKHISFRDYYRFERQYAKYYTHDSIWGGINGKYVGDYISYDGVVILEMAYYIHNIQEECYQPNVSQEEFTKKVNEIKDWQNYTVKINYNLVPSSRLLWLYEKVKSEEFIVDAIKHRCYDFFFLSNKIQDLKFCYSYLPAISKTNEKGIYLYIIMLLKDVLPKKLKKCLITKVHPFQSYEMNQLTTTIIATYDSNYNMYDLLNKAFQR